MLPGFLTNIKMDTYFARVHRLPSELGHLILQFASLSNEIQEVRLRPPHGRNVWNVSFFTRWTEVHELMRQHNTNQIIYIRPNGAHMYISW